MLTKMHPPPPPRSINPYLYKAPPKSRAFRLALPVMALTAALLLFVADGFSPPSAQANHIGNHDYPVNLQVTPLRTNIISHTSETIDVLLSWDPPAGFAGVGYYRYEYRTWKAVQAAGAGWTAKNTADATTSAEIKGLDPHKRYEFRARTETGGSPNHWSWHTGLLQFGPGGGTVAYEGNTALTRSTLNGTVIKVTLDSGNNPTFADSGIQASHFTFPKYRNRFTGQLFSLDGLSVSNVVRDSATEVTLTLAHDGEQFFTNQVLRVKIDSDALVIASGSPLLPFDLTALPLTAVKETIHHDPIDPTDPEPALPKVTGVQAVPLCAGEYPESERNAVCNAPVRQEGGKPVGDTLEVYWDQVADEQEIAGYEVQYRSSSNSAWQDDHPIALRVSNKGCRENYEYPGHPESCEVPLHHGIGPLSHGSYDVRVRVLGDFIGNVGAWSDTATGALEEPPAQVTGLRVITAGQVDGAFRAEWRHAEGAHSYRVEWTDAESFDPPAVVHTALVLVAQSDSHIYATSGLQNGTAHRLRIISVAEHGTAGEPSEEVEFTTLGTPPETAQQQRQPIVDEYDANGDGDISQDEVLAAIRAFYDGDITYEQLEEILAVHDSQSE